MGRLFVSAMFALFASAVFAQEATAPPPVSNWIYIIRPAREDFFARGATPEEFASIDDHMKYLQELHEKEQIIIVGRAVDNIGPGIVIFRAESEAQAEKVFLEDPAVAAGVFTGSVHPFGVALWRARSRPAPTVEEIGERAIIASATVTATAQEAWERWTTCEGLKKFLAGDCDVELKVGGKFELYFDLNASEGMKGSEGCTILSYLPNRMLTFSWNAPPSVPEIRSAGEHTHVVIDFSDNGNGTVTVTLTHLGWKTGEGWDKTYRYFDVVWPHVMDFFEKSFEPQEASEEAEG